MKTITLFIFFFAGVWFNDSLVVPYTADVAPNPVRGGVSITTPGQSNTGIVMVEETVRIAYNDFEDSIG